MFLKIVKKLKLYLLVTRDDRLFYSFINKHYNSNGSNKKTILVDFTHLGFKRWNIQLLITLLGLNRVEAREVIGFYPSWFFIWSTIQTRLIWLSKCIFNKDKNVFKLLDVQKFIAPRYIQFLLHKKKNHLGFVSKNELLSFEYKGVVVGDLIYDTYLKHHKEATVDVGSSKLNKLVNKACFLVDYYQSDFKKYNIEEVYLTHSVYLCYGIVARVALVYGATVYVTQNTKATELHKLTKNHPLQAPVFSEYPVIFHKLENKNERLGLAKLGLEKRFNGVVDSSIDYMKESAYSGNNKKINLISDDTDNVIIMLHCFFDSPHIYKTMLYPDFYEWAVDTIKVSLAAGLKVYLKAHPNGLSGNDKIVVDLFKKYPEVIVLDKTTSNSAIMNSKIDAVLTVYGTLGHEFPYKGIPVINAGDNPHAAYNFCYTPKTISEYHSLLRNVVNIAKPTSDDILDILQFYYIHNIYDGNGANKLVNDYIVDKFSPKEEYFKVIDLIETVSLNKFVTASELNYLNLN